MLVLSDPTWIYYAVLLLVLVASASWILKCAPGSSTNQQKKTRYTGVNVLQFLQEQLPIPVGVGTGWKLSGFQHDYRIWRNDLCSPCIGGTATLYGCYSKIKGSCLNLLNMLVDASKYPEWHIGVHKVKHITMPPEMDSTAKGKTKNAIASHVLHDVISLETDVASNHVVKLINKVSRKLQGDSLIRKIHVANRFWHREDKDCSWLLEIREESQEWTFYLIQTIEGLFEIDQCLLTVIYCPGDRTDEADIDTVSCIRLGALHQFVTYRKVQVAPFSKLTLPVQSESQSDQDQSSDSNSSTKTTPEKTLVKNETEDQTKPEVSNKAESSFMKRVRSFVEEKKEWYEDRKRKSSVASKSSTPVHEGKSITDLSESDSLPNVEDLNDEEFAEYVTSRIVLDNDTAVRDEGRKSAGDEVNADAHMDMDEIEVIDASEIDKLVPLSDPVAGGKVNAKQRLLKFLKSSSLSSMEDALRKDAEGEEKPEDTRMGRLRWKLLQKVRSLDLDALKDKDEKISEESGAGTSRSLEEDSTSQGSESETGDARRGIDGPLSEEERLEAEYLDVADKAASELLLEKMRIANIEIGRPYDEQALMTGGWIYCGLEKEVVILRKIYEDGVHLDGAHLQSYMGKGLIQVPPKTVFEAISNPRTRCIYDEMLKSVDILHEFENGMKIVHLQHEVSQLFRKELRDFCVLQSERIEGVKYLISLQSVAWEGCPETDDVPRAKMIASGWIIEPAMRDRKLFSMVTYITQMELGVSKLNTGYLVEELAAKQPMSIFHLRQYLAPSAASVPGRPAVPAAARPLPPSVAAASLTRPRSASSTLAAAAAAAASKTRSSSLET